MKVITLCGSTKFKNEFEQANAYLTLQGNIVMSVAFFEQSEGYPLTEEQAELLGTIHLKKIDLSDEIFVIDAGGYIGSSTPKEIEYARKNGKTVRFYTEEGIPPQFAVKGSPQKTSGDMDLPAIYGQMRGWERGRETEKNMLGGFMEFDPHTLNVCRKIQEQAKSVLQRHGIDVEHLLLKQLPYLKKEVLIFDHLLQINKIEHGDYVYELFEVPVNEDTEPLQTFLTLQEAVAEILSIYPEMVLQKTAGQVVQEIEFK